MEVNTTQISDERQSDEDLKEGERIVQRWGQLETEAMNWKTHWQEIYENIVPRKEDVVASRMPGDRRNSDLYDTTAVLANEMLASALHGMLTNPETKFFDIMFGDPKLDDDQEVKDWCQEVGDKMFRVLNSSNFQTEIYEIYVDLGSIGTACLYMEEDDDMVIHFSARAMKEVRIDENAQGLIDTVYRLFKWRPQQIIDEFGAKNCPGDVLRAHEKNSQDQWEILHAVEPDRNNPKGHKMKSLYVLKAKNWILKRKSYWEEPYAVPRWSKTTGEKYGRGPGMSMLPDILMVNAMMLTVIQGAQKTVDPPLMVADDGVIGVVRLTPGGITVVRPGSEVPIKPLITNAQIDFGQKMLEDVRGRIRSGFYIDQLQLQAGPQKTAEEVMQIKEDQMRLMGPVLGRQHFELLKPMITRLFGIMYRRGDLPKAPLKIQGKNFEVRYSSLIAKVQRMGEAQSIARAIGVLTPLAQAKPEILDIINLDATAREVWAIFGNNHKLLLDTRALKQKRQAQDQAKQQMAQQAQEQHQSQVAKNVAPMAQVLQQGQQQGQPNVAAP